MDMLKVEKQQAHRSRVTLLHVAPQSLIVTFFRLIDIIGLTFELDPAIKKKTRLDIKQRVHKKVFLLKGAVASAAAAAAAADAAPHSIPPQVETPPLKLPWKK